MNVLSIYRIFLTFSVLAIHLCTHAQMATNPVLWADVPDPDIIRVGETYYMTSTTMHFNPGVPIMKSKDLVNWETVNYIYNTLADNDATNLENNQDMYGNGSWASCLRYADGYFYVYFHSYTTNSAHAYRTQDIENGTWEHTTMGGMHDLSVLFDDDGKVWSVYGGPDVQIRELTSDGMAFMPGTTNRTLIQDAGSPAGTSFIVAGEGAHIQKINGMYYVFIITWPQGSGRTQVVWRADNLNGPWEGRVILNDNGVAQGQIVQTPEGKWYGLLFKDSGGVGRIPYLTNVTWEDGWPMMQLPETLDIPASEIGLQGICGSDDFNYSSADQLSNIWQWNHNPNMSQCSFTDRPGYFRITTSRTDANIYSAKNTLTQRTFGPTSVGVASMDVSNMQNGDFAGLSAFQDEYGFVGVKMSGGSKSIVMYNDGTEVASVPLNQNTIYLRANCNFQNGADDATFHYSLDGNSWTSIGNTVQMSFQLTHFCGYRFALFNYATQSAGGYVDFDYFKSGYTINNLFEYNSSLQIEITSPTETTFVAPATIPFDITVTNSSGGELTNINFYLNDATTTFHEEWTAPYAWDWEVTEAGTYQIRAVAYDNDGNTDEDIITITVNVPQGPYTGTATQIPGKIEFENFDVGGNGFAYYDVDAGTNVDPAPDFRTDEDVDIETCTDTDGGYNIGYTMAGEWLEYTVNVATSGTYDITFRVACEGDNRTISLDSDGTLLAENVAIPNTGGWQVWTDVTIENVELQAGEQILRLTIGDTDYVNLNYMSFSLQEEPPLTFELTSGWNLIGCPLEGSTNIETALQSVWDYVDMVKDMNGFYMKSNQAELNSLNELSWGKGYLIYVNQNCTLTW
jgi:xylan 1,4-beta-xylosidase